MPETMKQCTITDHQGAFRSVPLTACVSLKTVRQTVFSETPQPPFCT